MAYPTTPINSDQTSQFNTTDDHANWVLIEDVSIKSVGGHGIFNSGAYDHNAIEVNGIIEAKSQYYSGVTSDAAYTTVNVTETGDIVGYNAITVDGDNATISNDGHLNAYSVGIYVDGIGSKITNTGSIVAGSNYTEVYTGTAVYIDEGSTFNFANTGNVSATYGVTIKSSEGVITNSELAGIRGTHIAIQIDNLSGQSVEIINEDACGITSDGFAIRGSDGSERVTNAGYMKGKISLGAGNDSFDNRDGLIDHAIDGGTGDDIYILGSASDQIVDGAGKDSVHTEFTSSLKSYSTIENLKLLGSGNISGTGNALTNVIIGNDGNNILNGGPDSVVDTLIGGKGNDTYVLGSGSDKVTDTAGTDTITSTIGRSMAYYGLIENLKLLGTGNISGTGNSLANVIIGNSGNNILNGGVETTAVIDTLNGGAGNDTYVLGSGADKVIDSAGTDTITSLVSRNLSTFATIENLKLLGVSNISGIGNALANTLTGNIGANTLSGAAGNDVLIGAAGADKLDGGANTDTASYAGASAGVVANLATAAANTGDAKGDVYVSIENLTGSSYNDTLTGNTGINVLYGGAGADKLTGGIGADTFLFKAIGDTTVATTGQDTIFDFSHAQGDKISLSGIDANTALTGDQSFLFKGTAAFSGANGELRFEKQASDTYVYGDANGDKVADFVIHFDDAIAFQASDFLL